MTARYFLIFGLFLAAPAWAQPAETDWLAEARQAKSAGGLDEWKLVQSMRIGSNLDDALLVVGEHDPLRPAGEEWHILAAERADRKMTRREAEETLLSDLPRYADLIAGLPDDGLVLRDNGDTIVYAMRGLDLEALEQRGIQVNGVDTEELEAHVTVRKTSPAGPFVEQVVLLMPDAKGWRWLAQLDALDLLFRFAPHDTGVVVPEAISLLVAGHALYFFDLDVEVDIAYSDFEYRGETR